MSAQWIHALGWTLLDFVWQGLALACVAAGALHGLRRHAPQLRYLVACLLLALCALLPALGLYARMTNTPGAVIVLLSAGFAEKAMAARGFDLFTALSDHLEWCVAAWGCCAALLALRTAAALAWIARMRRHGAQAQAAWQARLDGIAVRMGVRRKVALRIGGSLHGPVTAGWLKPMIVLPASLLTRMPAELIEALLAHEMAHIRRHDYLVNLLQNAVETLLFYHPAVWWLSGRIRTEREFIADDLALRACPAPRRLAEALAGLAAPAHGTLALAASGGELMHRIRRLVRPEPPVRSRVAAPVLLLTALLCAAVTAGAMVTPQPVADRGASIDVRYCPTPRYPREAQRRNQQGTVVLQFTVSADGRAVASRIVDSSGSALLDEAAATAIGACRFTPSVRHGKPVAGRARVAYAWTID